MDSPASIMYVLYEHVSYTVCPVALQAPRVPVLAEDLEMKKLINTYGKTFHTWQVDRGDTLPLGMASSPAVLPVLPVMAAAAAVALAAVTAANAAAANVALSQAVVSTCSAYHTQRANRLVL